MKAKVNLIKSLSVAFVLCFVLALMPLFGSFNSAKAETSVTIAGQTVDMSSFETYNGASIRYDAENKGLRFVTGISQVAFGQLNTLAEENGYTVKYGTIVTYSYRVQKCIDAGKDFTKVALDETIETSGSKYVDFGVNVFRENPEVAGNVEFTAVLGIQESNYNIPMSARGYVVISDGENEEIYYANYEILNSTAENISHTLLEGFATYGVDSDTKIAAIAEYTKNETKDGFFMDKANSMMPTTNNSADVLIEENQSIGGRAGVTKYTLKTANKGWAERLAPAFTSTGLAWTGRSTVGHQNALNRQKDMGLKYVLFDIYLQDAFSLYFPTVNKKHAYVNVSTAGDLLFRYDGKDTTDTAITEKVKIYNAGGTAELSATYSGIWYTVVVDISCNLNLDSNSACDTAMSFGAANSSVYFDNVRYYRTDAWKNDIVKDSMEMDFSEFGVLKEGTDCVGFLLNKNATVGGREGVLNFGEGATAGGWESYTKFGFMFSDMWDAQGNATAALTNNRMNASGVKYISFDVYRGGGSSFVLSLRDGSAYPAFKITASSGAIEKDATSLRIFDEDGNQCNELLAKQWYTIVIRVDVGTGGDWSAINWSYNYENIAIDNIVYYYNAVPTLWK